MHVHGAYRVIIGRRPALKNASDDLWAIPCRRFIRVQDFRCEVERWGPGVSLSADDLDRRGWPS